jgi:hypothetical protein
VKRTITLAITMVLIGSQLAPGGDRPSSVKQFQFNLRVLKGDPLGSQRTGTLKVVAEPRLITLENRTACFFDGGEIAVSTPDGVEFVQVGRRMEGKASTIKGGKVRLDVTLARTTAGDRTEERIQLHTEASRTITTVRPGEVVKLRWGKGSADKQTWAELSVEEVKP